ncbi:hypothetical protein U9M48_026156, partial [Paspalum notatum var. saurae]
PTSRVAALLPFRTTVGVSWAWAGWVWASLTLKPTNSCGLCLAQEEPFRDALSARRKGGETNAPPNPSPARHRVELHRLRRRRRPRFATWYSRSPSPYSRGHPKARSRSQSPAQSQSRSPVPDPRSQARSRSRSHEREEDAVNRGNTLYVTGLSSRVTEKEVKDYFSKEGRVVSCHVVLEPHTRVSRGFAFVTMDTVEEAERCIKYLNNSVMEGRNITVEKKILRKLCAAIKMLSSPIPTLAHMARSSRRGRPRTPTPGSYLGHRYERRERGRYRRGYGGGGRDEYYGNGYSYRRSPPPMYSSYRESRDYYPSYRESRDYPPYRDTRDYSPHRDPRDYYESRGGRGYSPPPYGGGRSRRDRSVSPYRMPERGYTGGRRAGGGGYDR